MEYKVELVEVNENKNDPAELQIHDNEGNIFLINRNNLVKLNKLINCLTLYPDGMIKRLAKIYSK